MDLWRSCILTREDFSGLHDDCSFVPSFTTKSSVTLIAPQDENYEMLEGLLFYKLSVLTAIQPNFKVDDLISFSVLTKLTERPEDKVGKKGKADKVNNNLKATHWCKIGVAMLCSVIHHAQSWMHLPRRPMNSHLRAPRWLC